MKKIKKYLPLLFFVIFMIMSIVIPFKYYMIKNINNILKNKNPIHYVWGLKIFNE